MHQIEVIVKNSIDKLFKKSSRPAFYRDPQGDWLKVLAVSTILLIIIIIAHVYFFYKLNKGEFFAAQAPSTTTTDLLDRALIKEVNDYYDTKEKRFNELTISSTSSIDRTE